MERSCPLLLPLHQELEQLLPPLQAMALQLAQSRCPLPLLPLQLEELQHFPHLPLGLSPSQVQSVLLWLLGLRPSPRMHHLLLQLASNRASGVRGVCSVQRRGSVCLFSSTSLPSPTHHSSARFLHPPIVNLYSASPPTLKDWIAFLFPGLTAVGCCTTSRICQ